MDKTENKAADGKTGDNFFLQSYDALLQEAMDRPLLTASCAALTVGTLLVTRGKLASLTRGGAMGETGLTAAELTNLSAAGADLLGASRKHMPEALKFAEQHLGQVSEARLIHLADRTGIGLKHLDGGATMLFPEKMSRGSVKAVSQARDGQISLFLSDKTTMHLSPQQLRLTVPGKLTMQQEGTTLSALTVRGQSIKITNPEGRLWQGSIGDTKLNARHTQTVKVEPGLWLNTAFIPPKEVAGLSTRAQVGAFRAGSIYSRNQIGLLLKDGTATEISGSLYSGAARPHFFRLTKQAATGSEADTATRLSVTSFTRNRAPELQIKSLSGKEETILATTGDTGLNFLVLKPQPGQTATVFRTMSELLK